MIGRGSPEQRAEISRRFEVAKALPMKDVVESIGLQYNDYTHVQCSHHNHADSTPSLKFYPNNSFACFGCHWGGGPVEFVAGTKRMSNMDALRFLEDTFHLKRISPKSKMVRTTILRNAASKIKGRLSQNHKVQPAALLTEVSTQLEPLFKELLTKHPEGTQRHPAILTLKSEFDSAAASIMGYRPSVDDINWFQLEWRHKLKLETEMDELLQREAEALDGEDGDDNPSPVNPSAQEGETSF